MSASLVGSEMCIRDSTTQRQRRQRPQGRKGRTAGVRLRADSTDSDAVSYTHLTLPTICSV
eukprot:11927312-Alexandrium_andersonii.AAC.1